MSKTQTLKKKTLAIVAIVIVLVLAGAAYYLIQPAPGPTTVKIGAVLPLSGTLAQPGADVKQALDFAISEINARGGVKSLGGTKITVVYADSAGKPDTGAAEAERLITDEKVVAVIGAHASSISKTVSEVCERYQVVCITGVSTSPALTQRGFKWYFRTTPHDGSFAPQQVDFVNWLNQKYGNQIRKVAIIYEDTDYGTSNFNAWQDAFSKAGFQIVKSVSYHQATATSLTSEVASLAAANPDIVLAASYANDALLLMQAVKSLNFNPKLILGQDSGFIQPAYVNQVSRDGYYVLTREVFNWDLDQKISRLGDVNTRYKAQTGVTLNGESAREYTATWVAYYAIEDAGKKTRLTDLQPFRTAIRDSLVSMKLTADQLIMPWSGVQFDKDGQNTLGRGIIVQMIPSDGKYHTVYPDDVATTTAIYPFVSWTTRG